MQILAVLLALAGLYFLPTAAMRALDQETRLGPFEDKVEGVASEFMRRSPALRANWEEFRSCAKTRGCDYAPILSRRDDIIAREWPQVVDRLLVRKDWESLFDRVVSPNRYENLEQDRDAFFDAVAIHGADKLRTECVPMVTYRYNSREESTTYDTGQFVCQPDRKRPG